MSKQVTIPKFKFYYYETVLVKYKKGFCLILFKSDDGIQVILKFEKKKQNKNSQSILEMEK